MGNKFRLQVAGCKLRVAGSEYTEVFDIKHIKE